MKTFYLSLILCFFIFDFVKGNKFKFEDCSNGKGIVSIKHFTLYPDPISLSKNVTASAHFTLHEDLPPNTFIKRNIYKMTSFFGVPIKIPVPCIMDIGSCSTEGCKYLKGLETQVCPFVPPDLSCDCPLKAGIYSGDNVTIPMPQLGPVIKFLASGQFRLEFKLIEKDDWVEKDLACLSSLEQQINSSDSICLIIV